MTPEAEAGLSHIRREIELQHQGQAIIKSLLDHFEAVHDYKTAQGGYEGDKDRHFRLLNECPKLYNDLRDEYTAAAMKSIESLAELRMAIDAIFSVAAEQYEEVQKQRSEMN